MTAEGVIVQAVQDDCDGAMTYMWRASRRLTRTIWLPQVLQPVLQMLQAGAIATAWAVQQVGAAVGQQAGLAAAQQVGAGAAQQVGFGAAQQVGAGAAQQDAVVAQHWFLFFRGPASTLATRPTDAIATAKNRIAISASPCREGSDPAGEPILPVVGVLTILLSWSDGQ
jgi:hypothetical protein